MSRTPKRKLKLGLFCAVLSLYTLLAFHLPFFRHVLQQVESGANGVFIFISLLLVMLLANYFFYYLILWPGRIAGRAIVAASLVCDALCLYFINTYDVLIDASMMGNVFNTRYSEASAFFSWAGAAYVLLLGVLPALYVLLRKLEFGSWKRWLANVGASLALLALVVFANMSNFPWIDRNSTVLGSLIMPWSYTVNSIRWHNKVKERNREELPLPDARIADDGKAVCVLIIGESARQDHFSLYGYDRLTNPLLEKDSVRAYPARAAATYTTGGVKAILDHKPSDKLYEILPNYLWRNGVDVVWRTSNWGEPPLHIEKIRKLSQLKELYPDKAGDFDGMLFEDLQGELELQGEQNRPSDKHLIVLHTQTSHGPSYNKRYPSEFAQFTPECTTVEMSKADPDELINSYDNSILYTDYLIHSAIEQMNSLPPDWRCCVLYVSDHGESLGENNLYMHGVPISLAPREQVEIPFIVWVRDASSGDGKALTLRPVEELSQYNVFHSVLGFLGVESEIYNPQMDIFNN